MNKTLLKILIIGAVFVAATVIIFFSSGGPDEEEVSYTILGESVLPVVHLYAGDVRVDPLQGFAGQVEAGEQMESLLPLGDDMKIPFRIETGGGNITGIVYEVRSIDGSDLIEKGPLETWSLDENGRPAGTIRIKDIIEEGRQYRLVIKLTTERQSDIAYYLRIVRSPGIRIGEMLGYITDFHASEFDAAEMNKYAVNWEPDNTADNSTLARVNIHSSFRNLTYRDFQVTQVGEPQITILDMDERFGSFRVESLLRARGEKEGADYFCVSEFFCLQWTQQRFYLMKYERKMTQSFFPSRSAITNDRISFGIVAPEDVETAFSPDGTALAFVVGGELWCHDRDSGRLAEIFSMTDKTSAGGRLRRDYAIRIINVTDSGGVDFFVYGYMNRGSHEGTNGLSYYRYDPETGGLTEAVFMPTTHGFGLICEWIGTICTRKNDAVIFLFDNTLYSMNESGTELVRLVENASQHALIVNGEQNTIAWGTGSDEYHDQIRIRCLDSEESVSVSAGEGEYLVGEGFVDRDFVYTVGRPGDIGTYGFEKLLPRYALFVTDTAGAEIARYEKPGVLISEVTVGEGKLTLERMREAEGSYLVIDDEVLMQSGRGIPEQKSVLSSEQSESRLRVWFCPWESDGNADVVVPLAITRGEGSPAGADGDTSLYFFAYEGGELQGAYRRAGDAIARVYDGMGSVTDSRGYRVWNRTAKSVSRVNAKLPPEFASGIEPSELADLFDGQLTVSLKDCGIDSILRFIDLGSPVLFLDGDGAARVITGYDRYSAWIWDAGSGESVKHTLADADGLIAGGDRRIISFIRK